MRIIRIIFKVFAIFLLIFFVFWITILGVLQTQTGQKWATQQVIALIEQQTNSQIELEEIQFEFPLTLEFKNLSLSNDQKKWLSIDQCKICCLYPSLLEGRLMFSMLHVTGLHVLDLPPFSSSPSTENKTWQGALLPFYVQISDIDIRKIDVAPAILDRLSLPEKIKQQLKESHLTLQGNIGNYPTQNRLASHLKLKINHNITHQFLLKAGMDLEAEQLSFAFTSAYLDIPSFPLIQAHASMQATASLNTWQTILSKKLTDEQPITGHVEIILRPQEENSAVAHLLGSKIFLKSDYLIHSLEAIQFVNLRLNSPSISMEGETTLTKNQEILDGKFIGQIEHLENFQAWTKEKIEGSVHFEGQVQGPFSNPLLALTLKSPFLNWANESVDLIDIHLETQPQQNYLSGLLTASFNYKQIPWHLDSLFNTADNKHIKLSDLHVTMQQSQVQGNLSYSLEDSIVEGVIHASSEDLNDFSPLLGQMLQGNAKARIRLLANQEQSVRRQAFMIDLTGRQMKWKEGLVSQFHLNLEANPLENTTEPFLTIQTRLKSKDIQWKEVKLSTCTIHATHQADLFQQIIPDLTAKITAKNIHVSDGFIKQMDSVIHLNDPLNQPHGDLKWTLKQLKQGNVEIADLIGDTQIDQAESVWPFQLAGQGIWKDKWNLATQGVWRIKPEKLFIRLNALNGTIEDQPLILNQPIEWIQTAEQTELTPVKIKWGTAELLADYKKTQDIVSGHLQTNLLSTALFDFIAPDLPVKGNASLQGELSGTISEPLVKGLVHLNKIQLKEEILTHKTFIEGDVRFTLGSQGVELKSELYGIGKTPLRLVGRAPFSLSLSPLAIQVNRQIPLNIKVDAEGEVEPYLQLAGNDSINLTGKIKIALLLKGQLDAPQIEGFVNLTNGFYETNNTGTTYRNIQAQLEGNGSTIVLKHFSAQDSKNGTITGFGQFNIDKKREFPFKIDIKLNQIFVVDADYATMDVSGPLTVSGTIKKPKVQGTLTVNKSVMRMEESLPAQVKTVDVKYINTSPGAPLPDHLTKQEKKFPIELDIRLDIPTTLSIKGSKLSSDWKGNILVTGTLANILLNGDLRIDKGEFNLTGKVFNLSQGNIHFAGAPKKTSLYVVASKDIDNIRADIILKGTLSKPVVTFRSNPPLPQREVLSYILFNRGLSNITSDQSDQLNQSFIELSTSGQKSSNDDFLTRMRNNVGIDRLDLTKRDANSELSLQAGKYLTEDILISVNKGLNSAAGTLCIEANLIKNVKIQAEKSFLQENMQRISLKWHKDY
jgi:translocation and assembly module TamB